MVEPEARRFSGGGHAHTDGFSDPPSSEKKKYKVGIMIPCYNRPEYVKSCFENLKKSRLEDTLIVIVDDGSDDKETVDLIKDFEMENVDVVKLRNESNLKVAKTMLRGFDHLYGACEFMCNIDSDTIMKPEWIEVMMRTYHKSEKVLSGEKDGVIVTGFNAGYVGRDGHPIIKTYDDFYTKNTIGGANVMFHEKDYLKIFRNSIQNHIEESPPVDCPECPLMATGYTSWDYSFCNKAHSYNYAIVVTRPSVVQHIGQVGMNSGVESSYDRADDY